MKTPWKVACLLLPPGELFAVFAVVALLMRVYVREETEAKLGAKNT